MTAAAGILAGFAADQLLGDPRHAHPVAGFGRAALALEQRTYAPSRAAGAAHVAILVGGAGAAGALLRRAHRGAALTLCVWTALGARSLTREASAIGALVASEDLDGARARIPALVGRDPASLDADGLCRAAVESLAENTVDAVVAPLLWAAAAGPGGVLAYRAANTLDAMIGHRTPRYRAFGWAAARLDDGLNWPAARLSCVLAVAAAPLVGGSRGGARQMWARDGGAHPSPNGGRIEAAFAGALGVRLGGPVVYGGVVDPRPWLGDGPAPGPADVGAAVRLARLVAGGAALTAAALAFVVGRWREA